MTWGTRRQLLYILIIVCILAAFASIPIVSYFDRPETCVDKIQNQMEEGVDCGGPCTILCPNLVQPLVVSWARSFEVSTGFYDSVAFIENTNPAAGIKELLYRFKVYDADNVLIAERVGKTFVNPGESFAVIAPNIKTGTRIPARTFFEFEEGYVWERMDLGAVFEPSIVVEGKNLSETNGRPSLSATLRNRTVIPVERVEVVALLYGISGNILGAHATFLETLGKNASEPLVFTWQKAFPETPVKIDILPRFHFSDLRQR